MVNVVEIVVEAVNKTKEGFAAAEEDAGGFSSKMQSVGLIGAAALGGVAVATVDMASKFDSSMTMLQTQAGVSKGTMQQLSAGVLSLAGQVGFSPDSLAEAAYHVASNMSSMGATSTQMLNAVKVAAEGAATGHADLVDVTNALGAAIASGMKGTQNYSQAMGVLNATVGAGDMKMQDLANAFGSGLLATVKGFGVSITDVGAALAVFGDNNIRGAAAGTELRMAIQAMASPAKSGTDMLKSLGLTTATLATDMQHGGLNAAITDLRNHMIAAGDTGDKVGTVLTDAFGKKAGAGINILVDQYGRLESKYPELNKGANDFGQAWATTQQTLSQRMKDVEGQFEALAIEIGNKLMPVVQAIFGYLAGHGKAVTDIVLGVLALTGAFAAYALVAKTVAIAQAVLNAVMDMNPYVAVAIAVVAVAALVIKYHTQIWTFVVKTWNDVKNFVTGLWKGLSTLAKQVWTDISNAIVKPLAQAFDTVKNAIVGPFDTWWKSHGDEVKQVWTVLWTYITDYFKLQWDALMAVARPAFDLLVTVAKVAWDLISGYAKILWTLISAYFSAGIAVAETVFKVFLTVIETAAKLAWDLIAAEVKIAWAAIQLVLKVTWDVIVGLFNVFLDLVTGHWSKAWQDAQATAVQVWNAIKGFLSATWNALSGLAVQAWNAMYGAVKTIWGAILGFFEGIPGRIVGVFGSLGGDLRGIGSAVMSDLWAGIKAGASSVVGWLGSFAKSVVNVFKTIWGWFSPSRVMYEGGKSLMDGLSGGIKDHANKAITQAQTTANQVANVGSGVARWKGLIDQALQMEGMPLSLDARVMAQMQTESGGNPNAINLSDSNAAMGDPSRGLLQVIGSTFSMYHWPGTSGNIYDPLANIAAAINYARAVYGPSLADSYGGMGSGHGYAAGGATSAGWAMVGERGRELMKLPGGATVFPAGQTAQMVAGGSRGQVVQLVVDASGQNAFSTFMLQMMREHVRVQGGGDVQKAFGKH